jgi:hypothetical protein
MGRKMIGQILMEKKYITLAQLNEARRKQLLTDPDLRLPLGEVLVQMGYVAPAQVEEVLKLQEGLRPGGSGLEGHSPSSPSAPNPSP